MIRDRLVLLRDLLAETGPIFVHLDAHTGPYVKCLMDEIFGQENFQNEIAWYYYNKLHDSRKRLLPKAFDQILYYVKNKRSAYSYTGLKEPRDKPVTKLKYRKVEGKIKNVIGEDGKAVTFTPFKTTDKPSLRPTNLSRGIASSFHSRPRSSSGTTNWAAGLAAESRFHTPLSM